ncbi:hypothetical protein M569_01179, partial [Genlisea aurea]
MQSQIVCSGCRSLLMYPSGATNVRCALCSGVTTAPPPGMEMAQLICGGCRTLLMYPRGAASVRCSCCHTVNLPPASIAHINCGNCNTMLMYPYGSPSVKCAVCHYITNANANARRVAIPLQRPNGSQSPTSSTVPTNSKNNRTVVVKNPMSVDKSGKLVSNVVVGITTDSR